jgi:signal transduction histidine kinase
MAVDPEWPHGKMSGVKPLEDLKTDLELRIAFLGLTAQDLAALLELRPVLEEHAASLVSAFYRHLLSFEPTRALLADPAVKDRLLRKQREYLISLCGPVVDEAYVLDRVAIGETHERIGLEPRWYLGAYSLYFSLLLPMIRDAYQHDPDRCERLTSATMKLLMLDAQLAMEAYIARHERQLAHLNRELAEASRSLARDLDDRSEELRRSGRRVREAEELASVATLAAGLAHEIGTPMGVIQGHAEALEPAVADEKGRWRLRTIREQVERVSPIIQALLNMARPHETVRQPVDLEAVLETTLSFLGVKLKRRSIAVERDYRPIPSVLGDAEKLQQLFLNLGMNAADAMEGRGGALRVSLRPAGEGQVEVRFGDTGTGIPTDQLGRIFEPFFTTKPAGQGNGLGLVVAKGIVDDHGGRIAVESQVGQGTTFTIRLPAALASGEAD